MNRNDFYDYNLEITILSSLIFNETINPPTINPDIFYNPIHKSIYQTILFLHKQEASIDEVLIKNYLVDRLNIDLDNVEQHLLRILIATPTLSINSYVDILEDLRKKRDIKTTLLKLNQELLENKSADELESSLLSSTEKITNNSSTKLFKMTPASFIEAKDSDFITKNFIPVPKKTVTFFSAGGGTGKTSLLLQLSMRYLYENPNDKAFCWLSEDPLELTKHRLNRLISGLYTKGSKTLDRLVLSEDLTFPILLEVNRTMNINPLFYKMKLMLRDFNLIILDPLIAFFGGDENNNAQAKLFMQLFTKWAAEENKTIIFIHHSTKNTSQSRGASAFVDAARAVYEIEKIKDKEGKEINTSIRKISLTKDNYRASQHFGGFSKKIKIFPDDDNTNIKPSFIVKCSIDDELGIQ